MKRLFDFLFSLSGLFFLSPVLLLFIFAIFIQDRHSPFYRARRVGLNGKDFTMVKMRSMVVNADGNNVDSTSSDDKRITPVGNLIRKFKLDEITQLWNVLLGDMSIVGPRPQVRRDVELYSDIEKGLLNVLPGITDFSSIVFSDEGEILKGKSDPDLAYNQLIRPWKSKLGLLYIKKRNFLMDLRLIFYTLVAILNKNRALSYLQNELKQITDDNDLIKICARNEELYPSIPPGLDTIVKSR